ncbi:MAG: hypothetical protein ITG00_11045 [Flavobacterium sp.]|nr:hypothetical protein [Flavobacterium sp.]
MKTTYRILGVLLITAFASCNQSNSEGQTTPEGTTVTNRVNSDMEQHRAPAGTDSIVSPGNNASDFKTDNGQGTNTDANMQNQGSTHGKSTTSGDNGTGN